MNTHATPLIACLCPTYRRPVRLLANAIACFERQTYPTDRRQLIVLDDAGELAEQSGANWRIESVADRYLSLPAKYNALLQMAGDIDAVAVWEDDDVYLPWHLVAHVAALKDNPWSHPSRVWSLYGDELHQEPAGGRFHAVLAFRRGAIDAVGRWPYTCRADFDQQLIATLQRLGPAGDPCDYGDPSYVFRWRSTGSYHGQAEMRSPDDETWYGRIDAASQGQDLVLEPRLDEETRRLFRDTNR